MAGAVDDAGEDKAPHGTEAGSSGGGHGHDKIALLTPFQLGSFKLSHRVVMAPLTRLRAHNGIAHPSHNGLYYTQRATPGGLLISEAVQISEDSAAYLNLPGLWTQEHIDAWKPIVNAVHDKGAFFFAQIWHTGRVSHVDYQPNKQSPVGPSTQSVTSVQLFHLTRFEMVNCSEPRALEAHEIPKYVNYFRQAARNAIEAGFDGVEIHAGHGYLLDQFLKSIPNDRADRYGGSLENRCRFPLEVVDAVVGEIGAGRVGIQLSPFSDFLDVKEANPRELGLHLARELSKRGILYCNWTEPRLGGDIEVTTTQHSLGDIPRTFTGASFVGGGHTRESENAAVESGAADGVIYGRLFIANPDLVRRFELDAPLNKYDRSTFYTSDPVVGYTDYPFLVEES